MDSFRQGKRGDVRVSNRTARELARAAGRKMSVAALAKMVILERARADAGPPLPATDDEIVDEIKKHRPDAVVYTVPVTGVKIVASPTDDGWHGVAFDPSKIGSTFAWSDGDLNLQPWARTRLTVSALRLVSSRIDDAGVAHFTIPESRLIISARWDGERFSGGSITDPEYRRRQDWVRAGWYASMTEGPFNYRPNIRRWQNLLCRAMTVKTGGLETNVPA